MMTVREDTFTPPKYIAAQREREAPLLLEERLWEFIKWLSEQGITLTWAERVALSGTEIDRLIQDYVNS